MGVSHRIRACLAVLLGGLTLPHPAPGAPGDPIAILPVNAKGPVDIACDDEEGTYWVTSYMEWTLYLYDRALVEIGTVPLPPAFSHDLFSSATGIAFLPSTRRVLVTDSESKVIRELTLDGTPTGKVLDIAAALEKGDFPMGMAFEPTGDGGKGSIYVVTAVESLVLEIDLEGVILRSIPVKEELERIFGGTPALWDLDPIYEGGKLAGFYGTMAGSVWPPKILRFGTDWKGAVAISLDAAEASCAGLLRRPFPDPATGRDREAYICVQNTGNRFIVVEAGEVSFREIVDFRCELSGRRAVLTWDNPQAYDSIDVIRGCDVAAVLPGDADRWEGDLIDGVHQLVLEARAGPASARTKPCTLIVGPGQVINSLVRDFEEGALTWDGQGELIAAHGRKLEFFDLDLKPLRSAEVSEFFLGDGDSICGAAFSPGIGVLFLYVERNDTPHRHVTGMLDLDGGLLDSFQVELPNIEEDPLMPVDYGSVTGMAWDAGGDGGKGSLWVVEHFRGLLYELDLTGKVLRDVGHPFRAVEAPNSGLPDLTGIVEAPGTGFRQVYLSGLFDYFHGTDLPLSWEHQVFRMDLASGEIVGGSRFPVALRGLSDYTVVRDGGKDRLFALTRSGLHEIDTALSPVAAPTFLRVRQRTHVDEVEIAFRNDGPYDAVEVFRDCRRVVDLEGTASGFLDRTAGPGFHRYSVRGIRGGQASDFARDSLQVGMGAVLERASTKDGLYYPCQIAWNPHERLFLVIGSQESTGRILFTFDDGLRFVGQREISQPAPWMVKALAFRETPEGDLLLHLIVSDQWSWSQGASFLLVAENAKGEVVEGASISPPSDRFGCSYPVGLAWDPGREVFYYLEDRTQTFVEMDLQGAIRRTFPQPAPKPDSLSVNVGSCFVPERGTIFTTKILPRPVEIGRSPYTAIVELGVDGIPTGFEIPIWQQDVGFEGIAVVGKELIALSTMFGGELVRMKALPQEPFIRGDANLDGEVDLSDPIALLGHLFLGISRIACADAADADDGGSLDITDAILVLQYLYLGGASPQPPFPEAGEDPTGDDLGCGGPP
jgi:hypothetical protein